MSSTLSVKNETKIIENDTKSTTNSVSSIDSLNNSTELEINPLNPANLVNPHRNNFQNGVNLFKDYSIPIIGYEIMEERAKFTVFKINVKCHSTGKSWLLFRRFTDFNRLAKKLKKMFPNIRITVPNKKWFGNNFDPSFLEERISGLQKFQDEIMTNPQLSQSAPVRKFFCFDDPPTERVCEDFKEVPESLENVENLKQLLKEKEEEVESLKSEVNLLKMKLSKYTDPFILTTV